MDRSKYRDLETPGCADLRKIRMASFCQKGFTTFEVLATLCILGVMLALAAPQFSQLMTSFDKRNAEVQLMQDIRLFQAQAVKEGCQGIIKIDSSGGSYTFGCDYVPFSVSSPPVYDSILDTRKLPRDIKVSTNGVPIFNTKGQSVDETGTLVSRTITLSQTRDGASTAFNTGTLRPTGFFSFAK